VLTDGSKTLIGTVYTWTCQHHLLPTAGSAQPDLASHSRDMGCNSEDHRTTHYENSGFSCVRKCVYENRCLISTNVSRQTERQAVNLSYILGQLPDVLFVMIRHKALQCHKHHTHIHTTHTHTTHHTHTHTHSHTPHVPAYVQNSRQCITGCSSGGKAAGTSS
jgi:hypothetical protein